MWLAVAGLLNSALSVFYYARVLKVMYMDRPPPAKPATALPASRVPAAAASPSIGLGVGRAVAIGLIAVAIVAFGVDPQPVLGPIQAAATHFIAVGA